MNGKQAKKLRLESNRLARIVAHDSISAVEELMRYSLGNRIRIAWKIVKGANKNINPKG